MGRGLEVFVISVASDSAKQALEDIVDLRKFLHETMTSFEKRMVERPVMMMAS